MKKLALILTLLFTIAMYADKGGGGHDFGDDEPGSADPPNDNCAFCDETPIDSLPLYIAIGVGVIGAYFYLNRNNVLKQS